MGMRSVLRGAVLPGQDGAFDDYILSRDDKPEARRVFLRFYRD